MTIFPSTSQCMKWYKKLFWWLVSMCVIDSHIMYTQAVGAVSHIMYHLELVEQLALRANPQVTATIPVAAVNVRRLEPGNHSPEPTAQRGTKTYPTRLCAVCSTFHHLESRYHCEECKTPLCLTPCFRLFQKNKILKRHISSCRTGRVKSKVTDRK